MYQFISVLTLLCLLAGPAATADTVGPSPVSETAKRQHLELSSAFPNGIETSFLEYKDIAGQKRQDAMKDVLKHRPDLMGWLPRHALKTLFDGDLSNGEGVNYKQLKDGQAYIIMRIDGPTLPDGRSAELWEYEYLFFAHLPLSTEHNALMSRAIAWSGKQ